jgi:hypothetical protein
MPKDESDPEDPMEIVGTALPATEAELEEAARCFIEEFAWIGFDERRLLATFRDPHYFGVHTIYRQMGEDWVKALIHKIAAEWSGAHGARHELTD